MRRRKVVRIIFGMEYSCKGVKNTNRHKNRTEKKKRRVDKLGWFMYLI